MSAEGSRGLRLQPRTLRGGWRLGVALFVGAVLLAATESAIARGPIDGAAPMEHARRSYEHDLAHADSSFGRLAGAASRYDSKATHEAFLQARLAYKRVEWLAEHYTPLTAMALNGAAADRPDEENPRQVVRATGLQVIADMLRRSQGNARVLDSIALEARVARVNVHRLHERARETTITAPQLFDAARAQVARMETLGIAGYDTQDGGAPLAEAAVGIQGIVAALSAFAPRTPAADSARSAAAAAVRYLRASADFDRFDRFEFITVYATPLAVRLMKLRTEAGVESLPDRRVWRGGSSSIYASDAFDANAFAPPGAPMPTAALAALGARLFAEPRLSGAGNRSCASCHQPGRALSDGRRLPLALGAVGTARGSERARNTPTLYNAALQPSAFADARVAFLEDQIAAVIENPREMGGTVKGAARLLAEDPSYRIAVHAAFGALPSDVERSRGMTSALAAYLRTLVRLDSRFDRAIRGDQSVLTAKERLGFNVFMGKGRCGTCHFAPLFNGTVPPAYAEAEVEALGVPAYGLNSSHLDDDPGAGGADQAPLHLHAFKVPTVRNAAVTAPYMHNGAFRTLDQVVAFYDAGGGEGRGLHLRNQTLSKDSLHLTRKERLAVVAFMASLTDTTFAPER